MSELTKNAGKRFRALKRRPNMPEWYPVLQVVVGILFVVFIGYQLVHDVNPAQHAAPTTIPAIDGANGGTGGGGVMIGPNGPQTAIPATGPASTSGPAATVSTSDPGATDTAVPSTSAPIVIPDGMVALAGPNSTTVLVPTAAVDRARAIAKAASSATAVISGEHVGFSSDARYSIVMDVDPDGTGPGAPTVVVVTVTLDNGTWVGAI